MTSIQQKIVTISLIFGIFPQIIYHYIGNEMATLEYEITNIPAQVKKEVTCEKTLSEGTKVKMEIGEDELDSVVPEGKQWEVIANIRLVETDV